MLTAFPTASVWTMIAGKLAAIYAGEHSQITDKLEIVLSAIHAAAQDDEQE